MYDNIDMKENLECLVDHEEELEENCCEPDLSVFPWRVGGHHTIKLYRDSSICKPLNRREFDFYKQLPEKLRSFVPKYEGTFAVDSIHGMCSHESEVFSNGSHRSRSNPGSRERLRERERERVELRGLKRGGSPTQQEYLMLENLTMGYSKPCVLDLKIGTRMYGDFATEEKIQSQQVKARETTSGKLGLRVCGFQRYSQTEKAFQKVDKYMGRKADEDKFRQLLETFFTIRGRLQTGVIRSLVRQIKRLRQIISELGSFRFYSSSLLILYEGGVCPAAKFSDQDCETDSEEEEEGGSKDSHRETEPVTLRQGPKLKLIDFANVSYPSPGTIYKSEGDRVHRLHVGPDTGFLLGLDNLLLILKGIVKRTNDCGDV